MAPDDNKATSSVVFLWKSFRQVPPDSIPAVLDCLLASAGSSPSTLFASLIDSSPDFAKDLNEGELDSDHYNYLATYVSALCHLLKKLGLNHDAMKLFIWRTFIPLMKALHAFNRKLLYQVVESFTIVVVETNSWVVMEANLVPYLLRSVHNSLGMRQNEELESNTFGCLEVDKEHFQYPTWSLPLSISCHILASMLDVAISNQKNVMMPKSVVTNGCADSQHFTGNLILCLCSMAECMLPQGLEHRSCAISFLLPIIFKAFASFHSFEVVIHGQNRLFSRNDFFVKIWKCCKTLFSLGPVERRDAYSVLSLYLSSMPCTDKSGGIDIMMDDVEGLDMTTDLEFWDEIRKGLIDKESLVRKQSLHMLKTAVRINRKTLSSGASETTSHKKGSTRPGMTKREAWAEIEAKSLGVGKICDSIEPTLNSEQKWEAFVLLYEMLEEYGTHLVEAAWNHQVSLLLESSSSHVGFLFSGKENQLETSNEIFSWLAILWERGLHHDNPQVRCLILQSILGIQWKNYGNFAKSVPETFVLGSFLQAVNDPVHHKEFGVKGVYSSETIEGARQFLCLYASCLCMRKWIAFLIKLASSTKQQSFSRVGLMCLAECLASAAHRVIIDDRNEAERNDDASPQDDKIILLDALKFVIESSKQHFNPNYRLRVCEKILEAGASMVCTFDVPLEVVQHFISTFPREFTDYGGSLRVQVQEWVLGCGKKHCTANCSDPEPEFLKRLHDFPRRFTNSIQKSKALTTYDDGDLEAWESEARRWARVLFLAVKEECNLIPTWMYIQSQGINICSQTENLEHVPVKFLILTSSLVLELQIMQERSTEYGIKFRTRSELGSFETMDKLNYADAATLYQKFTYTFLSFMGELVSFANLSCSVFSSSFSTVDDLPGSVKGKLGGPSQRRLPSSTTTAVLQAITSVKTVALVSSWCAQFESGILQHSAFKFLWKFYWNTISSPACDSETGAEIRLAAYEALTSALKALALTFSSQTLDYFSGNDKQLPKLGSTPLLDFPVLSFLQNINDLLGTGVLVRTRRSVLMNWKWSCLESLLSIPGYAVKNGILLEGNKFFFSDAAMKQIFNDLVENLENAGEASLLPILRSVRLSLDLFAKGKLNSLVSSSNGVEYQIVWNLVRSSWILHASCNKRKVAPIAALLSSVLHTSLFADESMHTTNDGSGPLKWFIEKVLEEGTKSPRTIRLAALHLSGLWLCNPKYIKYYVKELKLLSLYGSVAFDEDFEGELAENHDTQIEISLLAKSPDPELSEAFINTELYARVSVAVLFYKLADLADSVGSSQEHEECLAALESGKLFLLELLDAAVKDKDLSKELYKKYSAIHRRKIRAWQMICVLSRFVCQDIVGKVTEYLHLSLSRNNLPAVRQYLETFAINTYLKFPSLVGEQVVPILRDYDLKPQALASYVFIAANVILHSSEAVQSKHLDELLPPIVPLLTSHHHSLRGFTQLLVYKVFSKFFPQSDFKATATLTLERRCFDDIKTYLAINSDCKRLRASMEGFLDAYDPILSVTPAGIFINRVEELEFECVPKSLMDEVLNFLNDVREDLRSSMAKDLVTIKNESLKSNKDRGQVEISSKDVDGNSLISQPSDISLDFQKKITLHKHEKQGAEISSLSTQNESYKQLLEIEKEDQLLDHLLQSRSLAMEKFTTSRQQFIMLASLVDRIPNLAGLARTCEVFKALGLAVPDANIVQDKQFQLISVTADRWVPIIEVPVDNMKVFLEKKKKEGYSILGLEQTANSIPLDQYSLPRKTVLVLGREKEGIPVDIIHILDACIEIPQLGVVRSLNVHVSGAIALWEYTRQQRS